MSGINSTENLRPDKTLFIGNKGGSNDVWVVKSYCSDPTVTLENIKTGQQVSGGVGSLNLQQFSRLKPEG